jgi:MFS family permease
VGFLAYEPRREDPLINPRFFRSIPFSSAIAIAVTAFAAFGGFLFLNTLILQEELGLTPLQAGLATVPLALMTAIASPISGRLVGRAGPRIPLLISGTALTAGALMLVGIDADTPLGWMLAAYVVFGLGFGLVNAPITNSAASGMPRAQAGVAAAIAATARQVGQTLGVAIVGALIASHAGAAAADLSSESHLAWWALAACGAVIFTLGLVGTSRRAGASAHRTATELNPEALAA